MPVKSANFIVSLLCAVQNYQLTVEKLQWVCWHLFSIVFKRSL